MKGTKPKDSSQCSFTSPASSWDQFHLSHHIKFRIIDPQDQTAVQVIFDQFTQSTLPSESSTGGTQDIVTVRKKAGLVGRRKGRRDGEDVPDVLGSVDGYQLKTQA